MRTLRTTAIAIAAASIAFSTVTPAAAAPPSSEVVVAQAPEGEQLRFPDIIKLQNGRLLAAFYEATSHVGPDGSILVAESSDKGRTWSSSRVAVDTIHDDRDPKLVQLEDGTVLLSFFETDWREQPATLRGTHVVRSTDNGKSWSEPIKVESAMDCGCGTPSGAYYTGLNASHGAPVELENGDLLIPLYGNLPNATRGDATVVRSTDGGLTWPAAGESTIAAGTTFDFQEPVLTVLDDGEIVALIRTTTSPQIAYLSRSFDNGQTWTTAEPTEIPASSHHLLTLKSGAILLTYGDVSKRFSPYRATSGRIITDPHGSWDGYTDIQIYDAGNGDQANPSSAEIRPGRFLTLSFDVVNRTVVGIFTDKHDYR